MKKPTNTILYVGNLLSSFGYSPTMAELLGPRLELMGYTIIYAGRSRNIALRFFEILFASFLGSYNKLLIDTYSTKAFYFALFSGLIAKLRNKKYYPILHGGNLPERLQNKKLANFIFGEAELNVAVSGYLESVFFNAGYKVIRIPNFLDVASFSFQLVDYKFETPAILWVRSFDSIYNPILTLNILELVHQKFPHAKLCMVGPDKDGSMIKFKNEIFKRGLNESVRVMGKLSKKDWHILSKKYNVFLNTTHIDNAPVSVTEAMALGLPVVSTRVGGIPWMIEHEVTGLLYPDGDSISGANAIIRLISEPELYQRIALSARKQVEMLDWDIIKNQWKSLLG